MTGVLNHATTRSNQEQGTKFGYKPFYVPMLSHNVLAGSECRFKVCTTARLYHQHGVQELVWVFLEVIDQHVVSRGIEKDNAVRITSWADPLLSCSSSGVASGPEAV